VSSEQKKPNRRRIGHAVSAAMKGEQ